MSTAHKTILIGKSIEDTYRLLCEYMIQAINPFKHQKSINIALPGGKTPLSFFEYFIESNYDLMLPKTQINFFQTDERYVDPTDEMSNSRMIGKSFISQLKIPNQTFYPVPTLKGSPQDCALKYNQSIHAACPLVDTMPQFDFILLGLGEDEHIASLFPNSPALQETKLAFTNNCIQETNENRLTLTYPVINLAKTVVIFATGSKKSDAVKHAIENEIPSENHPISLIKPSGKLVWLLDSDAALKL